MISLVLVTVVTITPGIWILANRELRMFAVRKCKLVIWRILDLEDDGETREERRRRRRRRRWRKRNRVAMEEMELNDKCREIKVMMQMEELDVRELIMTMKEKKRDLIIQNMERIKNQDIIIESLDDPCVSISPRVTV